MEFTKFINERNRMCSYFDYCECGCPLYDLKLKKETHLIMCNALIAKYPAEAETIVAKWSAEHPMQTRLQYLLKHFPNTPLDHDGTPRRICPYELGLMDEPEDCREKDMVACWECWNKEV